MVTVIGPFAAVERAKKRAAQSGHPSIPDRLQCDIRHYPSKSATIAGDDIDSRSSIGALVQRDDKGTVIATSGAAENMFATA